MYREPAHLPRTPCWHCRHRESFDPQTRIARCGLPDGPKCLVAARRGCVRFEREPGIDDDDWDPKPPPFVPTLAPRPRNVGQDGWWTEPRRPRRPVASPPPAPVVNALPARDPFGGLFNWADD